MSDSDATVAKLRAEIDALRTRIKELEVAESLCASTAQALKESEQRLCQTTESLPVILLSAEAMTNRILLMIGAIKEIYGYDRRQFLDDPDFGPRVIHPDDGHRVYEAFAAGFASRRPFEITYRIVHGVTGEPCWLRHHVVPIYGPDGELVRQDCVILNITDKVRTESELRFQANVLDMIRDHISVTDLTGRILYVNEAQALSSKRPKSELVGQTTRVFGDDRLRGATQEEVLRVTLEKGEWRGELVNKDSQGNETVVDCRTWIVRDEKGNPSALCGVASDITARKKAEQALHETERRLWAVIGSIPVVLFSIDREGVFTLSEGKGLEMLGLKRGEVVGRSVFDVYQDNPQVCAQIRKGLAGEASTEIVEVGGRSWETILSPILDARGRVAGVMGVAADITERNRLQNQLLQSQKLQSIGTLAGGVAHDFGNLLAVIVGNLSIVLRQDSVGSETKDLLRDVMDAAERASALTHQLLAFARGGLQKPVATSLNCHVESVLQIMRRTAPRRIDFAVNLAPDLPRIIADPTQMEQVVMNLCLNAIEASQSAGVIEVFTSQETLDEPSLGQVDLPAGEYVRLCVRDQGCGMGPETLNRMFEPFFSTKPTGRGMGLAATQGIVHSHKGQIQVHSAPGKGTTVCVWLPIAPWEKKGAETKPGGRPRQLPRGSETVLVIDDIEKVGRLIEGTLSSLGYCVVLQTSFQSALAFLDNNSEDVDLVLFGTNALHSTRSDPLKEIHKRCPKVPVLVAGRSSSDALAARLLKHGAAGFVRKPVSIQEMATAVRAALDPKVKQPRKRKR